MSLTMVRESKAEEQKESKGSGIVVIRQRCPSALLCVYSVSAHDICAEETNLSPMRKLRP